MTSDASKRFYIVISLQMADSHVPAGLVGLLHFESSKPVIIQQRFEFENYDSAY